MPTYQYVCESCGENYELVQKFSDATLTHHEPGCGGPVHKKFTGVGISFKGTGFYRNDSRDTTSTTDKPAASAASGSGSGSGSGSTEAKPATPTSTPAATPSSTPSAAGSSSSSGSGAGSSGSSGSSAA